MARKLLDAEEFLKKHPQLRVKKHEELKVGQRVACFVKGELVEVGTVKHVGRTKLGDQHEDGVFGDAFILSCKKSRRNTRKKLHGLLKTCTHPMHACMH